MPCSALLLGARGPRDPSPGHARMVGGASARVALVAAPWPSVLWLVVGALLRTRSAPFARGRLRRRSPSSPCSLRSGSARAWRFFGEFGEYPSWSELAFLIEESSNWAGTVGLFAPWLDVASLSALLAMVLIFGWLGLRSLRPLPFRSEPSRRHVAVGVTAAALLTTGRTTLGNVETPSTPDANFFVAATTLVSYYATRSKGDYYASERPRLPEPHTAEGAAQRRLRGAGEPRQAAHEPLRLSPSDHAATRSVVAEQSRILSRCSRTASRIQATPAWSCPSS